MRVLFAGELDDGISVSSHHARLLAQAGIEVAFDEPDRPWREVGRGVEVLHVVTGLQSDNGLLRRVLAARAGRVGIIRFWTGLDALWARVHGPTRRFAQVLDQLGAIQLTPTQELAEGLRRIGVSARPGVIASMHISSMEHPQPLPAQLTVLCRLPADRREFFGGHVVDALVRRFRVARFLILGDDPDRYRGIDNVEVAPFVEDVSRTIQRASVLVLPVRWACRSRLMLEALSHGRHVVGGPVCPHARAAHAVEDYAAALRDLLPDPPFNLAGREDACRLHDRAMTLPSLHRELTRCLDESMRGPWLAAKVAMRNPGVYGRRTYDPPSADALPPDLGFLRLLLPRRVTPAPGAPLETSRA